jgi:hypothetical protein
MARERLPQQHPPPPLRPAGRRAQQRSGSPSATVRLARSPAQRSAPTLTQMSSPKFQMRPVSQAGCTPLEQVPPTL